MLLYLLFIVALGDFEDFDPVLGRQQLVQDGSLIGVSIHERQVPPLGALTDCALNDTLGGCLVLGDIAALEDFPLLVNLLQSVSLLRWCLLEWRGWDLRGKLSRLRVVLGQLLHLGVAVLLLDREGVRRMCMQNMRVLYLGLDGGAGVKHVEMLGLLLVDGLLLRLDHLTLVRVKLLLLMNFLVSECLLLLHVLHVNILRMRLWWWHLLRVHGLLRVLLLWWHHRLGLIVLLGQLTDLLSHWLSLVLLNGLLLRLH